MKHILSNEPHGLTRQGRKTLEAIWAQECVDTNAVHMLLLSLGYKKRTTGTHQHFTHPNAQRISLVYRQRDDGIWGWELNGIRKALRKLGLGPEKNTMAVRDVDHLYDEKTGDFTVKDYYDTKTLAERKFKEMNKLHIPTQAQPTAPAKPQASEVLELLKRQNSMLQSTQDFLLELGAKVDSLADKMSNFFLTNMDKRIYKVEAQPAAPAAKEKMSKEEIGRLRDEAIRKKAEEKRAAAIERLRAAVEKYPEVDTYQGLAVLAKVSSGDVPAYLEAGNIPFTPSARSRAIGTAVKARAEKKAK